MNTTSSSKVRQEFAITAPDAMSVLLVGDFTNWQKQPIPLKRRMGGIWQGSASLSPGTHHYKFLVDGQWRDDPECSIRVQNVFGTLDSIRVVNPCRTARKQAPRLIGGAPSLRLAG